MDDRSTDICLTHMSGSKSGKVETFSDFIVLKIGRHPKNDISFHPQLDVRASGHHAEIRHSADGLIIVDLNSRNGTFVNGKKISEQLLQPGDRIDLGKGGPQLLYEIAAAEGIEGRTAVVLPDTEGRGLVGEKTMKMIIRDAVARAKRSRSGRFGSTTVFMKALVGQAVNQSAKKLKYALAVLGAVLLVSVGGLVFQNMELKENLAAALESHRGELKAIENRFNSALEDSRSRSAILKQQLNAARSSATMGQAQLQALRDMLDEERRRSEDLARAIRANNDRIANLNTLPKRSLQIIRSFQPVARDNADAIFMVCGYDSSTAKTISIGTAFVVKSSGLMLTNAHVASEIFRLKREFGEAYTAVVVQNGHPNNVYRIEKVTVHPNYNAQKEYSPDMAALNIDTGGAYLKPVRFAPPGEYRDLGPGYELAVIGFPEVTMDPGNPVATLSGGAVGRMVNRSYIQHDCQTSGGNSGSPLFNLKGQVVGIHFGGAGNVHVFVPTVALDADNNPIKNADGVTKMTLGKRRIKQAIGINLGVRCDIIESFIAGL